MWSKSPRNCSRCENFTPIISRGDDEGIGRCGGVAWLWDFFRSKHGKVLLIKLESFAPYLARNIFSALTK